MTFRAEVYTPEQLNSALNNPHIEIVYVPYSIVKKEHYDFRERIVLIPPVYLANCEEKLTDEFRMLKNQGFNKVLVHTIGHIELFSAMDFEIYGGYRLNCTNAEAISFFRENNVKDIIVSPEITSSTLHKFEKSYLGFIAYGHLPLMITRRCPLKNGKPCNKKCCNRVINDRKGNSLNIICSENTAEILNSDVLYLADKLNCFDKASFAVLRFTTEKNITEIIAAYINSEPCKKNNFTRGLYFRGVRE